MVVRLGAGFEEVQVAGAEGVEGEQNHVRRIAQVPGIRLCKLALRCREYDGSPKEFGRRAPLGPPGAGLESKCARCPRHGAQIDYDISPALSFAVNFQRRDRLPASPLLLFDHKAVLLPASSTSRTSRCDRIEHAANAGIQLDFEGRVGSDLDREATFRAEVRSQKL